MTANTVADRNPNSPVFFMIPPGRAAMHSPP
jgi:hypothetical protein